MNGEESVLNLGKLPKSKSLQGIKNFENENNYLA